MTDQPIWTPATRRQHSRAGLRHASDLTEPEWRLLEPLVPPPRPRGRRRVWPMREVVNAILYVLRTGCPWRLLPEGLPPWRAAYRWFARLRDAHLWEGLNDHLVMADRERAGREASPTAAVIDSQSRKTTESSRSRGYDAGKKVLGRKRHALVDTDERALVIHAHPASVGDRDGAGPLLRASHRRWLFVALAYADAGYAGPRVATATTVRVKIVRKPEEQVGFAVHPRRWVVERSFTWLGRNRRLAHDFETAVVSAEAFLHAASVNWCSPVGVGLR